MRREWWSKYDEKVIVLVFNSIWLVVNFLLGCCLKSPILLYLFGYFSYYYFIVSWTSLTFNISAWRSMIMIQTRWIMNSPGKSSNERNNLLHQNTRWISCIEVVTCMQLYIKTAFELFSNPRLYTNNNNTKSMIWIIKLYCWVSFLSIRLL